MTAALAPESPAAHRVGWGFMSVYTLAFMSTNLVFLTPLLVTLPLRVNSLVGIKQAPSSLALVAGIGALVAMFGNPFFGRMSDRTSSRLGMRRPWMVIGLVGGTLGILIVALAPNISVVLVGWCTAQRFFNALLAALVAVLPDQVRARNAVWSPVSWVSVCRSRRSLVPFSSNFSPATRSLRSWSLARLAGSSSCSSWSR